MFSQGFCLGGTPRAPSVEKQGPCNNIRGTKVQPKHPLQMICYVKNLPDPIWQTGCFWFDNDVYARIFAMYMGPMKVRETNFKTLKCFDIMFFLFIRPNQMLGCYSVCSPLKLLNCRCSKVCLTCSIPLHPRGCIFFFFMRHLS